MTDRTKRKFLDGPLYSVGNYRTSCTSSVVTDITKRIFLAETLLFPFFVFFSLHSLKYGRTVNTHVNIPVKLLSPPVSVDSTRFSLYVIIEESRKLKRTHFKY